MRGCWAKWRTSGKPRSPVAPRCSLTEAIDSFESVTDRFLIELRPVAAGQVPKDADFKYENLVQGLKHVPIKVSLLALAFCGSF